MWSRLPDLCAEKKAQNPVMSLTVMVSRCRQTHMCTLTLGQGPAIQEQTHPTFYLRWGLPRFHQISEKYKIKSALPPPKPKIPPPPLKRGILWTWVFPAERTHFFQASIKLTLPFPGPELRTIFYGHEDFSENWVVLCHFGWVWSSLKWHRSYTISPQYAMRRCNVIAVSGLLECKLSF